MNPAVSDVNLDKSILVALITISCLMLVNATLAFISAVDILNIYNNFISYPDIPPYVLEIYALWPAVSAALIVWGGFELVSVCALVLFRNTTLWRVVLIANYLNLALVPACFLVTGFYSFWFTRLLTLKVVFSIISLIYLYLKKEDMLPPPMF